MKAIASAVSAVLLILSIPSCLVAEEDDSGKKSVWSTVDVQLYGYIKLDASYDTGSAVPGNFARWVELVPEDPDDDAFNMTANQTRLGLEISGPEPEEDEAAGVEASGVVEIDFYGGGPENKAKPLLRHAFVRLDWPRSRWQLLAGQTSDLISPLVPTTLNYSVAWWVGNIGYRRPQIRVTKVLGDDDGTRFLLAAALARTIGDSFSDYAVIDAGADSGVPSLQARLGVQVPLAAGRRIDLGLSGHSAEEEYDTTPEATDKETFDSWSINFDYRHQLSPKVTLQLELFQGTDLATYLGGIAQGVNLEQMTTIDSKGGWMSLDFGDFNGFTFHLGASLDDPDDRNLEAGDRSRNQAIWGSGVWSLNKHVKLGLELSQWATEYKELEEATSFRSQFSIFYTF